MTLDPKPDPVELAQQAVADARRDLRLFERKIEELTAQIPTAKPASLANMRGELAMLLLTRMAIVREIPAREDYVQKLIRGDRSHFGVN